MPTHSINGTRYIDGGVRSADNADLASGYANVVVLCRWADGARHHRNGARTRQASSRACAEHRMGADLASQVEALRKQGARTR